MKLKIEIDLHGAAFDARPAMEVQRILATFAGTTHNHDLGKPGVRLLYDTNNKRCGYARCMKGTVANVKF